VKLENNVTCNLSKIKQFPLLKGFGNHLILDKTCEKLSSNFTHQHLITHTKLIVITGHFKKKYHNTPCVSSIFFGESKRSQEKIKTMLTVCKFWRTNKEYSGIFESAALETNGSQLATD